MTINNCSELLTRIQSQVNVIGSCTGWCQVSGNLHTLAIKTDGTLWTWGFNSVGRLGDGTASTCRSSPGTVAGGGTNWCQVSTKSGSTIAVKRDGTLWTWGSNSFGTLGDGTTISKSSPGTIAGGGTNWCQVSNGQIHSIALKTDGTIWTWGYNGKGQLGDGTITNRSSPGTVAGGDTNWCQVSSGYTFTAAIKTDGTLWTWGYNLNGLLGDGTAVSRRSPGTVAGGGTTWCLVSGGYCSASAIKTDGTIWTWGCNASGNLGTGTTVDRNSPGTVAGGTSDWRRVSTSSRQTAAIKSDGTLWTWGNNSSGELGDGTLVNRSSPGTIINGGNKWCLISNGNSSGLSIKCDGTLWTWGFNSAGRLGDGTTLNRCCPGLIPVLDLCPSPSAKELTLLAAAVSQATNNRQVSVASSSELPDIQYNNISNGQMIFLEDRLIPVIANNECWLGLDGRVLRSDAPTRTLFSWGFNAGGRLGDGTVLNRCSPGTVAGGGTNWCQFDNTGCHTAAIKTDGTLWTWGCNDRGSLGNGATLDRSSPGTVAGGGTNWCQVSTGRSFSAAIKTDGTLWTWGENFLNSYGVLGDGTTLNRSSPGTVAGGGTNWCQVSSREVRSAAIKTDGTLWTWGRNDFGLLGDGTIVSRCSPGTVAGGGTNWCLVSGGVCPAAAIKTDGTLWTWGRNCYGVLGDGTTVSRSSPGTIAGGGITWCNIRGGSAHMIAIKTDGTLWTWGRNTVGQLGDGTTVSRSSPGTIAGGGTLWCNIIAGCNRTAAIKTDGTIWTWGDGLVGQMGDGTTVNRCSPGTIVGGGTTWCCLFGAGYVAAALQVQ